MLAGIVALLATIPTASADVSNGLQVVPDGGASIVLLALGCSGLAIAARKRFKR